MGSCPWQQLDRGPVCHGSDSDLRIVSMWIGGHSCRVADLSNPCARGRPVRRTASNKLSLGCCLCEELYTVTGVSVTSVHLHPTAASSSRWQSNSIGYPADRILFAGQPFPADCQSAEADIGRLAVLLKGTAQAGCHRGGRSALPCCGARHHLMLCEDATAIRKGQGCQSIVTCSKGLSHDPRIPEDACCTYAAPLLRPRPCWCCSCPGVCRDASFWRGGTFNARPLPVAAILVYCSLQNSPVLVLWRCRSFASGTESSRSASCQQSASRGAEGKDPRLRNCQAVSKQVRSSKAS